MMLSTVINSGLFCNYAVALDITRLLRVCITLLLLILIIE